jgi:hypothetical protein
MPKQSRALRCRHGKPNSPKQRTLHSHLVNREVFRALRATHTSLSAIYLAGEIVTHKNLQRQSIEHIDLFEEDLPGALDDRRG